MKILFIYPLLALFLNASCGSSKETATQAPTASNTTDMSSMKHDTLAQDNSYRLLISFISIGEGTDLKAREMMDGVLNSWKDKKGKVIEMESIPWGREGEVDYCFKLKELDDKEQAVFVDEIKATFKDNSLVQISENQPCSHKR